ncbi:unnamed protein product [Symbiodinium natans]|uniref:EF-hand domain-containing protein n=1 Tax=Symbiodinium natans TaxID=878477 RepID=A0A812QRE4_9DINO|nr:unnamed protein product [Symbiodinium natans]
MSPARRSRLWTKGDSTDVTWEGSNNDRKRGHIMIIRPVEHAYILSGQMMLSFTVGRWLLQRRWPLVMLITVGLLLHTGTFFGFLSSTAEAQVSSFLVKVSTPTAASWCMHAATTVCWGLAILVVLTRVHSQLLWMTLRTFDPWAVIACALRGWGALALSRMSLHHDVAHRMEDVFDLFNMLELSVLIVIVEAADLPKSVQKMFVAACLVYSCVLATAALFMEQLPNWDPHANLDFLFFASMSPKSQFIGAYSTMAILLFKAAGSVILNPNHFMFLRCPLMYCLDEVDASFAKLARTDPAFILYSDFHEILLEMGVSDSHILAGFNALDLHNTGIVTRRDFRHCMKEVFLECPGASHESLLTRLCQNAFASNTGFESLESMMGLILAQWRQIKLDELGTKIYIYLMLEGNVQSLFKTVNVRVQALLFAAFVQVVLTWLQEKNFRVIERDITSLGMRHIGYGVHPCYLCLFQLALLRALEDLYGLSERAEMAWSVVWLRFVAAPFTQGRLCAEDTSRKTVASTVRSLLQKASADERFIPSLAANLNKVPAGHHNWTETIFRDSEHELSHMSMLASFLEDTADKLLNEDVLSARRRLRQVVSIHWDRGIFPRHMLTFQYAATITFRDILGPQVFDDKAESLWVVFFQMEIMDTLLLAPFAETHDKLEAWVTTCKMPYVDQKAWDSLMKMAGVQDELSHQGYQRLCGESWKEAAKITPDDVLRTLCDESMHHPSWKFERVIRSYCSAKAVVTLLE